jgi:hypothetical protein
MSMCCFYFNSHKYNLKFKKLDALFASDIVGDGNNDIIGPFQTAQTQFYNKGVIDLCIGGIGEINEDFNSLSAKSILAEEKLVATCSIST